MHEYKDFEYLKYILKLPLRDGLTLYNSCIERINDRIKQKEEDRLWDLYLIESQHNEKTGSFEEYKRKVYDMPATQNLDFETKENIEARIINDSKKIIQKDRRNKDDRQKRVSRRID